MGEIKSTMDLVMERTRHLSLSAEEKARQRREDFEKRLQGLLQQYADGAVTADQVADRIAGLQTERNITDRQLPVRAVFKRIDPDQDNRCWLALLARLAPSVQEPLQEVLAVYNRQRTDLLQKSEARMREDLARDHAILGSAVVPNPERDAACREKMTVLQQQTKSRIAAINKQIEWPSEPV
jgi:hypothetical protein